jgi:hypothetical protein
MGCGCGGRKTNLIQTRNINSVSRAVSGLPVKQLSIKQEEESPELKKAAKLRRDAMLRALGKPS